ncbi:MAG: class I SAM-dependent rRNA methyltransferase [Bacteroidales bacterium]|nr:class I SAM-dependent rRNA methyltransferase [Bacteroidales bacterium]
MQQNPLYPVIRLGQGKDDALRRFHPWVFSGAIHEAANGLQAGDTVTVTDYKGEILGTGFCESDSIAVKMLSFDNRHIDEWFFHERIKQALEVRRRMGLVGNSHTNCYRLIHSEGDGLAGLIVDIYGHTAVVQAQTEGMALHLKEVVRALKLVDELGLQAIYNKSAEAMQRMGKEDEAIADGYLFGSQLDEKIMENGSLYLPNWEEGQKTGFFLDQRENRELIRRLSEGRTVLNAFGYTGGFSIAALKGGARRAVTVDTSKKALAMAEANLELNGYSVEENPCVVADMKDYVKDLREGAFDLIILDPPAFAKRHQDRHRGLSGYRFINAEAIKRVAKGGLIATFSCSQAVDKATFQGIVTAAAIEAKRNVRIIDQLAQPVDHPINIFHPEGAYLKGLLLYIE